MSLSERTQSILDPASTAAWRVSHELDVSVTHPLLVCLSSAAAVVQCEP